MENKAILTSKKDTRRRHAFLISGILLGSAVMRSPLTSVSSILNVIQQEYALSGAVAGSITAIPTMVFAVISLIAPLLLKKWNAYGLMFTGMAAIAAGILLRSYLGLTGFFAGTLAIGLGIGLGNALIPKIIKQDFPQQVERYTGVYTSLMNLFAAFASGISVPLANAAGWKNSLALWCPFVCLAAISWFAVKRVSAQGGRLDVGGTSTLRIRAMLRSPMAWKLTLCMGFQSVAYFCVIAWLPSILQERGMEAQLAGYSYLIVQVAGMASAFAIPMVMRKMADHRPSIIVTCLLYIGGLLLLYIFPTSIVLQVLMLLALGIGTGTGLSYTLTVLSLRAATSDEVVKASVMVQTGGYIMATVGPPLLGGLFDLTQSMNAMILSLGVFAIGYLVFGAMVALRPGGNRGLL